MDELESYPDSSCAVCFDVAVDGRVIKEGELCRGSGIAYASQALYSSEVLDGT